MECREGMIWPLPLGRTYSQKHNERVGVGLVMRTHMHVEFRKQGTQRLILQYTI